MNDEDESGPEPTGIICRVWPTGCAHPHLCQDACFDDDIVRERGAQEKEVKVMTRDRLEGHPLVPPAPRPRRAGAVERPRREGESVTTSEPSSTPRRLWCRCHHRTAWQTKKGWTMRYRCTNGAWGGGGGYPADAALDRALRWCADCPTCLRRRTEQEVPVTAYLPCPLCDAPAIPASGSLREDPTWAEDDEADCPGCGEHLRANITGDGEREWIEAVPTNENLEDLP